MKNHRMSLCSDGTLIISPRGAPMVQFHFREGEADELVKAIERMKRIIARRVELQPAHIRGQVCEWANSDENDE